MSHKKHAVSSVILAPSGAYMFRGAEDRHYALTRASRTRLMNALHRMRWLGIPCPQSGFVHFKRAQDCSDLCVYLDSLSAGQDARPGAVAP